MVVSPHGTGGPLLLRAPCVLGGPAQQGPDVSSSMCLSLPSLTFLVPPLCLASVLGSDADTAWTTSLYCLPRAFGPMDGDRPVSRQWQLRTGSAEMGKPREGA